MLIVIDTNGVVSAAISSTGAPAEILRRWRSLACSLAVSEAILVEYERALNYDRVRQKHSMDADDVRQTVAEFRDFALLVEPTEFPAIVSDDPDDDKFLWCAEAAGASVVVSRDEHLLKLRVYHGIRILTPAAFIALLDDRPADER